MLNGGGVAQRHAAVGHERPLLAKVRIALLSSSWKGDTMYESKCDVDRELLALECEINRVFNRLQGCRTSGRIIDASYYAHIIMVFFGILSTPELWDPSRLAYALLIPCILGMIFFVSALSVDMQIINFSYIIKLLLGEKSRMLSPISDPVSIGKLRIAVAAHENSGDYSDPKEILKKLRIFQGSKSIMAILNCFCLAGCVGCIAVHYWKTDLVNACIQGFLAFLALAAIHMSFVLYRSFQNNRNLINSVQNQVDISKASLALFLKKD